MTTHHPASAAAEQFIRDDLARHYSQPFTKRRLQLVTGGVHEFDAVSRDGGIVAEVKALTGLTSGGNKPSGKISDATVAIYWLSLVPAQVRLLVLTNASFHEIFMRDMKGKIAPGVDVVHVPIPGPSAA